MKWSPPAWLLLGMIAVSLCGCSAQPPRPAHAVLVYRCPRGYDAASKSHNIDVWQTPDGHLYFQDQPYSGDYWVDFVPLAPGAPPQTACLDVHGY